MSVFAEYDDDGCWMPQIHVFNPERNETRNHLDRASICIRPAGIACGDLGPFKPEERISGESRLWSSYIGKSLVAADRRPRLTSIPFAISRSIKKYTIQNDQHHHFPRVRRVVYCPKAR